MDKSLFVRSKCTVLWSVKLWTSAARPSALSLILPPIQKFTKKVCVQQQRSLSSLRLNNDAKINNAVTNQRKPKTEEQCG